MIKAAISSGFALIAALISAIDWISASATDASSKGNVIFGFNTRGQSNLGKYNVFRGSGESVRDMVYPERPWKQSLKWRIFSPFAPFPDAKFLRTFQSNDTFNAFSTASVPPST